MNTFLQDSGHSVQISLLKHHVYLKLSMFFENSSDFLFYFVTYLLFLYSKAIKNYLSWSRLLLQEDALSIFWDTEPCAREGAVPGLFRQWHGLPRNIPFGQHGSLLVTR